MKKIILYLISLFMIFNFASCENIEGQSNNEETHKDASKNLPEPDYTKKEAKSHVIKLKSSFQKNTEYDFEELEIFEAANIDKDNYEIRILDVDNENILLSTEINRENKNLGEGIGSTTRELYLYNPTIKKIELIAEFNDFYLTDAYILNDKYIVLGINLGIENAHKDRTFSILYGDKNNLKKVHKGINSFSFIYWPRLIKLNTGIILLEPEIELTDKDEFVKKINFYKFENDKFNIEDFKFSNDFKILETKIKNTENIFVSFWENIKEKKAYFILIDKNGIKKTIPFPKEYRLNDFTITNKNLFVSIQDAENTKSGLLIIDIDTEKINSVDFKNMYQMTSLSGKNKFIATPSTSDDIYIVELKDNEIMATIIPESSLPKQALLFTEYQDKILLNYFTSKNLILLNPEAIKKPKIEEIIINDLEINNEKLNDVSINEAYKNLHIISYPKYVKNDNDKNKLIAYSQVIVNNNKILSEEYNNIYPLSDGMFKVMKENENGLEFFGYLNNQGKEKIKAKFAYASNFNQGIAVVSGDNANKYFIDKEGKNIFNKYFINAKAFSEDLAAVCDENFKWGFIDKKGNYVLEAKYDAPNYENALVFKGSLAYVIENGIEVLINNKGEIIFKNAKLLASSDKGKHLIEQGNKKLLVDYTGKIIQDLTKYQFYNNREQFFDDALIFKLENKYGYINLQGNQFIEAMYDNANNFCFGYAPVSKNNKWGIINKKGEVVIDFTYDFISKISSDGIAVGNKGRTFYKIKLK